MNKLLPAILLLLFYGCANPPQVKNSRYIEELRGYIQIEKKEYNINEDIIVSYMLTNDSGQLHQEPVTNGSKIPQEAFHEYSFNSFMTSDKNKHMQLKEFGKPLTGAISLKPKQEKVFVRNTFVAVEAGTYTFSFKLHWRENKEILFTPIEIKIIDNTRPTEVIDKVDSINPVDPKLQAVILNLVSKDREEREIARQQLEESGQEAFVALVETMGHENVSLRSEAMLLLIDIGKTALPALAKGTNHPNREIRMRSVYALGEIDPIETMEVIRNSLLNDPEKDIREAALKIISIYADFIAVPLMIMSLDDKDVALRSQIITQLRERTRENFGYDPEANDENRKAAIEKWKAWARNKYKG